MDHPGACGRLIGIPRCSGCRRRGAALCRDCDRLMRPAEPTRIAGVSRSSPGWVYAGPARGLVLDLKLRRIVAAAGPLAEAVVRGIHVHGSPCEVLTWVPARAGDVRRRGFDHAQVLAVAIGTRLGLPVRPLIRRVGAAPDQAGLTAAERSTNLAGSFYVATPTPPAVGVVDDLVTTGATMTACAFVLRRAGAQHVEALAPTWAQGGPSGGRD